MGANVKWISEKKKVLYYELNGNWNWQNFEAMLERGYGMTESVSHQVHMLIDFTNSKSLPDGSLLMWKKMVATLPKNQAKVVFIGGDKKTKTAIAMFVKINKKLRSHIIMIDTVEQALRKYGQGATIHSLTSTAVRVLVIDDEAPLREEVVDMLSFEGYDVISAHDGASGLQQIEVGKPDLIVCDVAMPQMDGYQLLNKVRADPSLSSVPFIFLTAHSDRSFMRYGMELGADDYLTKPFTHDELLSAIKTRQQRLMQQAI